MNLVTLIQAEAMITMERFKSHIESIPSLEEMISMHEKVPDIDRHRFLINRQTGNRMPDLSGPAVHEVQRRFMLTKPAPRYGRTR